MANPEHLEILKQGVEVWNQWRETNREIQPDLREANLRGIYMWGANLWGADLSRTQLSTMLVNANLWGSYLNSADLAGAILGFTTIGNVDLSKTYGFGAVNHIAPSYIGIETLELTAIGLSGNPSRVVGVEAFFRCAGVPEHYLEVFRYRVGRNWYFSSFISYSHSDGIFSHRLRDRLQALGIRCWLDDHQMIPGDDICDAVDRGIRLWDKVLLCCSEQSLTSWWVNDEIDKALEKERKLLKDRGEKVLAIIPLNLDGYLFEWKDGRAATLRKRLAADFTDWEHDNAKFEEQFGKVVKALRAEGREAPPEPRL